MNNYKEDITKVQSGRDTSILKLEKKREKESIKASSHDAICIIRFFCTTGCPKKVPLFDLM